MTDQSPRDQGIDHIEAVLHTTQAGAILPAARAAFFGLMIGLSATAICLAIDPIREYWLRAGLIALAISVVASLLNDEKRRGRLFDALETRLKVDIDGDGDIGGEPIPDPDVKEIHGSTEWTNDNGHRQGAMDKIVFNEKLAAEFARGVLITGLSTAERNWKGAGKPFGDDDWDNWIAHLLKLNAIKERSDKNFRLGYEITKVGVSYLMKFLSEDEQWKILDKYWDMAAGANPPTANQGS